MEYLLLVPGLAVCAAFCVARHLRDTHPACWPEYRVSERHMPHLRGLRHRELGIRENRYVVAIHPADDDEFIRRINCP